MEGQDRVFSEHCKADLMEVKERVVPAELLRYLSFWVQVHSSCVFLFVCLFVCVCACWLADLSAFTGRCPSS